MYNISERYGDFVKVTIQDYRALNPSGDFSETDDGIYEGDELIAEPVWFYYWTTHRGTGRPDRQVITQDNPADDPMLAYSGDYNLICTANTQDDPESIMELNDAVIIDDDGYTQWA